MESLSEEQEKVLMDIQFMKEMSELNPAHFFKLLASDYLFHQCSSYFFIVEILQFLKEAQATDRPFREIQQILVMKAVKSLQRYPPQDENDMIQAYL